MADLAYGSEPQYRVAAEDRVVRRGDPTEAPKLTQRTLAKMNTRAKLLKAARRLFTEQGYEGATIRDIAAAAGMSTGAVFANFTEKFDLFREIAAADMIRLTDAMRSGAKRGVGVDEAMVGLFAAGYDFYLEQLPLIRATMHVMWSEDEGREIRQAMPRQAVLDIVLGVLKEAVAQGELKSDGDLTLRGQMLCDLYSANFRLAVFDAWTLDALQARLKDQVRIILSGARPA